MSVMGVYFALYTRIGSKRSTRGDRGQNQHKIYQKHGQGASQNKMRRNIYVYILLV